MAFHRLLERQLSKAGVDLETVSPEIRAFITKVNEAYVSFDEDRALSERAMNLSSCEMLAANKRMAELCESANAAAVSKGAFLANMSHEIRTPLTGIIGLSEILLEEVTAERHHSTLEMLNTAAQALLRVLNDVLDLSKLEYGQVSTVRERFSIRKLVEEVHEMFTSTIRDKDLTVIIHVESEVPQTLIGDEIRTRQIFVNLLGNAMKFNRQHGVIVVYVDVESQSTETVEIHCAVSDTGIGIPAAQLETIFDSFTQVDESTSRKFGGTGLGLAICRRIVELLSGRIWARSIDMRGSAFHFVLPFGISAEATLTKNGALDARKQSLEIAQTSVSRNVLVAEDNAVNRTIICRLLRKLGWGYSIAENGEQAVALAEKQQFDLILMDCQMPVLCGYEATRIIREHQSESGNFVPIIAMTANALEGDREKCIAAGMDDYIAKPFQSIAAMEILVSWIGREHMEQIETKRRESIPSNLSSTPQAGR